MKHGVLLACLLGLAPALARAELESALRLSWEAPSGCPQLEAVETRLRELTSALANRLDPSALVVDGRIDQVGESYRLTLLVRDGNALGTRIIASQSCADLADAAAVALGLLVSARHDSSAPTAADNLAQPDQPRRAELPSPPSTSSPPESERETFLVVTAPSLTGELGALPAGSLGTSLGLGVAHRGWSGGATGLLFLPTTVSNPDFPGFSARITRASLRAAACRSVTGGSVQLAPCLNLTLEHVWAEGRGPGLDSRSPHISWLAPGLSLRMGWLWSPKVGLSLDTGLRCALTRPRFLVEELGELGRVGLLTGSASVSVEWFL